jgi:hypothetical protein
VDLRGHTDRGEGSRSWPLKRRPLAIAGASSAPAELDQIRRLIAAHPAASRAQLSRLVCAGLGWAREDGRLKEMSCRVAMLRMQADGLLQLPPPRNGNHNGKPWHRRTALAEPDALLRSDCPRALGTLQLHLVSHRAESQLHNEYLDRYHYLGYQPLPGAQLRYFVRAGGRLVALLSFGAAAWKTQPRDHYIGWTPAQRQEHLHRVVNNARFLILPWIECKNLASSILARAARQIAADWPTPIRLLAALARNLRRAISAFAAPPTRPPTGSASDKPPAAASSMFTTKPCCRSKTVWVYPLDRHFRRVLCA